MVCATIGGMATTISIAMIVKNEAQHLPECLAQARGWADEICVVDTGSTDETVAIARATGCVVSAFAWCDDFSAARNASIAACTGDWIFVLDADERIAAEDWAEMRGLVKGKNKSCAYRFTTRNYTDNVSQSGFMRAVDGDVNARGFGGWFPSAKVRLFPNGLGARFEGAVHELINPSLARAGVRIVESGIAVHHYPLTKGEAALREKAELYLRLGRAKVGAAPGDAKAHAELGNQYVDLGDFAQAARCYSEALKRAPESAELWKDLGAVLHMMGRGAEAERALRVALAKDAGHVEAWRNLGVVLGVRGAWAEAAEAFRAGLEVAPGDVVLREYLGVALGKAEDGS